MLFRSPLIRRTGRRAVSNIAESQNAFSPADASLIRQTTYRLYTFVMSGSPPYVVSGFSRTVSDDSYVVSDFSRTVTDNSYVVSGFSRTVTGPPQERVNKCGVSWRPAS